MDFGKDKKIESLEQKIGELSENINKLSEKQNSQYTDIMMVLKETQDSISETKEPETEEDPFLDDELYEEAKDIAIEHQRVSSALLQRKLHIGYTRSARLVDQLEENGVIGPADGSNPREVLIQEEED